MKVATYKEQYQIIQKSYLNAKDVTTLVPVGINHARKIINEVIVDMLAEKAPVFNTRVCIAPTDRVLAKLGLSADEIKAKAQF